MSGPTRLEFTVGGTRREGEDSPKDSPEDSPEDMDASRRQLEDAHGAGSCWMYSTPQVSVSEWGSHSGQSSGSCTPQSRSPSLVSMCSDTSWGDGFPPRTSEERTTLALGAIEGKSNRCSHMPTSSSATQLRCLDEDNIVNTRFCASQETLAPEVDYTKRKQSLKNMFLDVFHLDSSRRGRSATQDRHRNHSNDDSPVRKLLSKIRSRSQSDLLDSESQSSSGSLDLQGHQERRVSLNPEVKAGIAVDVVPPTAINTRLLGRYRKNSAHQTKRRWSLFDHHLLKSRSSRLEEMTDISRLDSSGDEQCTDRLEASGETMIEGDGGLPDPPLEAEDHSSQKRRVVRTRSNSESTILVKKKKKRKDSRMIDRLLDFRHRKYDLRGSLPSLLVDKLHFAQDSHSKTPAKNSRSRDDALMRGIPRDTDDSLDFEDYDKASRAQSMHDLTDYADDDYYSPEADRRYSQDSIDSVHGTGLSDKENQSPFLTEEHARGRKQRFSIDNIWNAFRGRRLSQDVGAAGKHVTDAVVPWIRSKSRSVDHSIHSPFDLDALRRKIGERASSEPSRDISPSPEALDGSKENICPGEKVGGMSHPPLPSMTYTVSGNDTLTSIAARFDTTPSELAKLNKLSTRFVYPGQVIVVPDKTGALLDDDKGHPPHPDTTHSNGQDLLAQMRPPSPLRGDLKTPVSLYTCPRTPANSVELEKSLDRECLEKFLKISVRHITDGQGVVAGVLLVTPNAVMFDPNVSDPLVIEHGPESYGVIAPMEFVVNAALYYDIAHMRVKDTSLPKPEIPKPEIYWGPNHMEQTGSQESPGKDASLSKDATFPELAASQDDNDSSCSCGGDTRESSAFPKAFEHELLTPIGSDVSPASGDGQPSSGQPSPSGHQQQTLPVAGDLTPIAEASRLEDSQAMPPNVAQTQCNNNTAAQDLAQTDWTSAAHQMEEDSTCNDKKRTTSVTFDITGEEEAMPDLGSEASLQESRKQKVLKRLSYPLSWMESFNADKESIAQHQGVHPTSAPPVSGVGMNIATEGPDGNRAGMFSNVFSMSNVSNMLSRRPSMDFARRPLNQQPLSISTQQIVPQTAAMPASGIVQQPLLQPQPLLHPQPQPQPQQQQQQTVLSSGSLTPTSNQPAHKRAQYKEGTRFGLKSMVSMDDMPELFASFDKLIPKPATSCEDPPLYLCLRMGKPACKRIPKSTPVMSYGKKRMRPEYWFSIPKNRSDELFHFFQLWAHDIYGELNEDEVSARGFVLVEDDTELWADQENEAGENEDSLGELTEMTKESWEVVSMSDELRRALYSSASLTSLDLEAFLPEICGVSEIITDAVRKNMYKKLPARAQGYSWKLVFSTAQHGFSLNSLYRKMNEIDTPIMLFIQDTHQNIFGAVVSCSLRVSELYYGTGESFLFSFHPEFQVFPWTGENTFFVKGNNESLVVGGGDGNFGLWLDGDLYQGRTQPCKTYNNPQLTDSEDFIIKAVECWCFE